MQLEIVNTDESFAPITGLTDIIARLESPVDELRREITKKLIELKYLPPGSSPKLVRIRDKCSNLAGKILNNGTTLSQNGIYSVYDGKTLCIQILEEEENLAEKFITETENLSGQNSMNISRQNSPYSLLDKLPGYFPYVYDSNHYVDITNTKMRKFYSNDGIKLENIDAEKSVLNKIDDINIAIVKARSEDDYDSKKNNKNEGISERKKIEGSTSINSDSNDNNQNGSFNHNIETFRSNKINPVNEPNQPEKSTVIINNNTIYNNNSNSSGTSQSYTDMNISRSVNAVLLQIQVWNRRTFTVGKRIEVLIRQDEALKSVAKKLASYFNIPLPYLRILFVPSTSEINLCDLPLNCPTKYSTRAWFDGSLETRKLSDLCEMKLYDGDLLLLQNNHEPLRELTEAERKSVEKKNQIPSYYDYPSTSARNYDSTTLKSKSNNFENSTYSTVLQFGARTKKKENGVFIKTQKERKRQSDKEEEEKRVREEAKTQNLTHDPSSILTDSPASPSPPTVTDTAPAPVPVSSGKKAIDILPPSELDQISVRLSDQNQLNHDSSENRNIDDSDRDPPLGTDDDAIKMGLDILSDLN
jgi:hypothetical protein